MFLDISHLNDDGMEEIFEKTEIPLLATHSNARSVQEHYRNLTDEQLEWLARRNGIVGINACTLLSGSAENGRHLEMLVRQGEYLLERAGENLFVFEEWTEGSAKWTAATCMARVKLYDGEGALLEAYPYTDYTGLKKERWNIYDKVQYEAEGGIA